VAQVVVEDHGAYPKFRCGVGGTDEGCQRRDTVVEVVRRQKDREPEVSGLTCLVLPLASAFDRGDLKRKTKRTRGHRVIVVCDSVPSRRLMHDIRKRGSWLPLGPTTSDLPRHDHRDIDAFELLDSVPRRHRGPAWLRLLESGTVRSAVGPGGG
jgi:hypothetical protein